MGKKRIAVVGETSAKKERKIVRTGKEHGRITDVGTEALEEAKIAEEKVKKLEREIAEALKKKEKVKKAKPAKKRGAKYLAALKKVDRNKLYPLSEAVKILKSVSISRFNGSIDAHLVVKKIGLKGEIKFPYSTGKSSKVAIATDEVLKQIAAGKIDFTTLIATPAMMPKLTKYAKILGPRGLMPNPKAGTITDKPEELAKKLAGTVVFKTESKAPLIHITIGKVNSPEKEIEANFKALVEAVGQKNIKKAVLAPTMGPGIKIDLGTL